MDKQEIQRKIDSISADRDALERTRNKLTGDIALLLQQIAEAEKPKLGHGDFGIWTGPKNEESNIQEFIHLLSGGKLRPADKIEYYSEQTTEESNYCIFGNIFKLMKDWGETLEEFASINIAHNQRKILLERSTLGKDAFITIAEQGGFRGDGAHLSLPELEELWRKFGHRIIAIKRKQS